MTDKSMRGKVGTMDCGKCKYWYVERDEYDRIVQNGCTAEVCVDEKLKGCPHCGGEARVSVSMKDNYFVWCKGCHNQTGYHDKREQAISAWNRRGEG